MQFRAMREKKNEAREGIFFLKNGRQEKTNTIDDKRTVWSRDKEKG